MMIEVTIPVFAHYEHGQKKDIASLRIMSDGTNGSRVRITIPDGYVTVDADDLQDAARRAATSQK